MRYFILLFILFFPTLNKNIFAQAVVISEILVDPACFNDDCEYVEIKNRSGLTVDIGNWSVRDNESGMGQFYVTFPAGTSLASGGTIIATKSLNAFNTAFSSVSCPVYELDCGTSCPTAGLANDGDFVGLYNSSGDLIHSRSYPSSTRQEFDGSGWSSTSASSADPCFSPLPVTLLEFRVFKEIENIRLNWTTASERNNAHFTIERSSDGRSFTEIGRVGGAGNSNDIKKYDFTDERPLYGLNYYRLKQTDFDGRFEYSPLRSVMFGAPGRLTLAPVPATGRLNIQLEDPASEDGVWQIFDVAGRTILYGVWAAENMSREVDLAVLPEGVYVFQLATGRDFQVRQFIKR